VIVVGIDGGMVRLGLAAVEGHPNNQVDLLSYDLIENPRGEEKYNAFLAAGITRITNTFPRFLDQIRPDFIVSETIPVGKLGSSDSQVVAAVTTCRVIAIQFGIPWHNIAANTVKVINTSDGRASKTLIRNTMLYMFPEIAEAHAKAKKDQKKAGLKRRPGLAQDYFDAIAVAVAGYRQFHMEINETEAMQEMQKA